MCFQFAVVRFVSTDNESEEVAIVSKSWLLKENTYSYWPPKSIPIDRAARMSMNHAKPDPNTWEELPIIFEKTYGNYIT